MYHCEPHELWICGDLSGEVPTVKNYHNTYTYANGEIWEWNSYDLKWIDKMTPLSKGCSFTCEGVYGDKRLEDVSHWW